MTKSVILVSSEQSRRETAGIKNFDFKLASALSSFCSYSFNSLYYFYVYSLKEQKQNKKIKQRVIERETD